MPPSDPTCTLCQRLEQWRAGSNPAVIQEFEHSLWVVGDHQFFPGYTLLLLKDHVRDLHVLPPVIQQAFFAEVMAAARIVVAVYAPWKMNYSCYGNLDPHLHWHLIPRRADEPQRILPPFTFMEQFASAAIDADEKRAIADRLRAVR